MTIPLENNCLTIEVFRDTSAIELFLNDRLTMSTTFMRQKKDRIFFCWQTVK
ncbi:hypothetical protein NWO25_14765 [Enterococcus lactis]|nr:hypothetical protein [Enterococcus lactis]